MRCDDDREIMEMVTRPLVVVVLVLLLLLFIAGELYNSCETFNMEFSAIIWQMARDAISIALHCIVVETTKRMGGLVNWASNGRPRDV